MSASHASIKLEAPPSPVTQDRIPVARAFMPDIDSALPYLRRIDQARWYTNHGPLMLDLEARLAERFAAPTRVVTVSSGTTAITIALQSMGLRPGGRCILPAWTFVATAHAVVQAGLEPWFVDVDPETWMLDPEAVRDIVTGSTVPVQAVIPVAAHGRLPDLAAWERFRSDTGVAVLLDAAAAFDALDDARVPAVVSLHATKALGVGEGGFVATRDPALAEMIQKRANFGFHGSREAQTPATNAKLSEYAAALGHAGLDRWSGSRMRYMMSAQRLRIAMIGTPEIVFQPGWGSDWISTVCVVRLPDASADRIESALAEEGIETRRWWGGGCHTSRAFADCRRAPLPVTDALAGSTLGLPFSIDMDAQHTSRVAATLERALSSG